MVTVTFVMLYCAKCMLTAENETKRVVSSSPVENPVVSNSCHTKNVSLLASVGIKYGNVVVCFPCEKGPV